MRKMDGKNNERKTMKGIKQDAVREEKKIRDKHKILNFGC